MPGIQGLAPLMGFMRDRGQLLIISLGLLVLRLGFGLSMAIAHGYDKLTNFDKYPAQFMNFMGLGPSVSLSLTIFAEFFCAIAIALGLFTRLAAIPLIINMSVAFFIAHGADPFKVKEMAFLYLAAFTTIFITGPGWFSIDGLIWGRGRSSGLR